MKYAAVTGGALGVVAGGLQIASGIAQGLGGAGYSNATNGAATLAASALVGGLAASPVATGYRTVSQRASDRSQATFSAVTGGVFDLILSRFDSLGPQQVPNPAQ